LEQLELPSSLHSLVLSRIDQLTESQKSIIKVASVIGRSFRASWVWGMYPDLGDVPHIKSELEVLNRLDLAPLDMPEPELVYLFKHIVTQEVAYNSLPYATRAKLHENLGLYLEQTYPDRLDELVDLLAFHYEHSDNEAKKREYFQKAGEAAQADYANEAALGYYQRLLPLLSQGEQIPVLRKLAEVLQLVGRWNEAGNFLRQALALAEQENDLLAQAWCQTDIGELLRQQRLFTEAWDWLEQARANFERLNDLAGLGQALHYEGTLAWNQGNYETAQRLYEASLALRRQLDDKSRIASLLSNLGLVAHSQGNYEAARRLYEESLDLRYQVGNKWAIAISLNNLGYLNIEQGDYTSARTQLEVALNLQREVGHRWAIGNALNNLGNVARAEKKYEEARTLYEEGLIINKELGDREAIAYLLEDLGGLAALQAQAKRALRLVGTAEALRETIGAPLPPAEKATLERLLEPVRLELGEAGVSSALVEGRAMSLEASIDYALEGV
jgi:predicted ATPase